MKTLLSCIFCLSLISCIRSTEVIIPKKTNYFPTVSGLDLTGKNRLIPQGFKTDKMIVIVAYLQKQQADVDTWFPHIKQLLKEDKNLEYFELPTISKMSAPMRSIIYNGMRGGIKSDWMRKHVVTLHLDKKTFNKHLKITNEKQVYLYLLEKDGKIIQRWDGLYSLKKLNELKSKILQK